MPDTERWGRVRCDGLTHLGLRQLVITHAAVRESQQLHSTQPQQTQTQTPVTAELVLKLESAWRAIEMTLFALHH